jgi:hypothetical protein
MAGNYEVLRAHIHTEEAINSTLEGETDVLVSDTGSTRTERYDGSLRPHAEGTLEAFE